MKIKSSNTLVSEALKDVKTITPEEALNCFLRTKMDILVLGNWVIVRN